MAPLLVRQNRRDEHRVPDVAPRPMPEVMAETGDRDALDVALGDAQRRLRVFQVYCKCLCEVRHSQLCLSNSSTVVLANSQPMGTCAQSDVLVQTAGYRRRAAWRTSRSQTSLTDSVAQRREDVPLTKKETHQDNARTGYGTRPAIRSTTSRAV
ncbi:hypothetical protein FKP32DRAFT_1596670 [Trametes sanguinea]|nr:hypothetical protein FKP32DRAFT_1596670 [Trametes sanguinea]